MPLRHLPLLIACALATPSIALPAPTPATALSPHAADWRVLATFVSSRAEHSWAVLALPGQPPQRYQVNALPDGHSRLHAIRRDGVLLEQAGHLGLLPFAGSAPAPSTAAAQPPAITTPAPAAAPTATPDCAQAAATPALYDEMRAVGYCPPDSPPHASKVASR